MQKSMKLTCYNDRILDGINESLKEENPIETMEEDTVVNLIFDKEKLYKNMVDAKLTGCMNYRSGITSLHRNARENCIKNRKIREQSAKKRKLEEMIHVHVEAGKSIKNAAVNSPWHQDSLHLEF